jgi:hypothetical protein
MNRDDLLAAANDALRDIIRDTLDVEPGPDALDRQVEAVLKLVGPVTKLVEE